MKHESTEDVSLSDWFNILVLHQNRYAKVTEPIGRSRRQLFIKPGFELLLLCTTVRMKGSPDNGINERLLPNFLDLVICGHEHECLVDPKVMFFILSIVFLLRVLSIVLHLTTSNKLLIGGSWNGFPHHAARIFNCHIADQC